MNPSSNEPKADSGSLHFLALLSLWSLGVAQPLLETLASGPAFLVAHRWLGLRVALLAFGVVLLPPTLMWLGERIAGRVSESSAVALHRLWIALLSTSLMLLVVRQVGLDGMAWIATGILAAGVLTVAYVKLQGLRVFVRLLSIAAVVVPVVFLLTPGVRALLGGGSESETPMRASSNATAPVVWIVADEWALSTILTPDGTLDREVFPHLAALADDATWYRRAASVSGATELAVPALLAGTLPAPEDLPVPSHRPQHLFSALPEYGLWAQEVVSFLARPGRNQAGRRANASEADAAQGPDGAELMTLLSDLRWLYLHRLVPDGLRHQLPPLSDRWRGFGGGGIGDREAILDRFLPTFEERLHADRIAAFDRFLEALGPDDRQLYFLHLLLPHTPYRYLPDGRRYRIASEHVPGLLGERWSASQARVDQAHQRYLLQTRLLDHLVGRLVARMKEVGLYDKATLVLVSDHGISFHAGELRRTATAGNAHELLPVPLFVKAPGQTEGRVVGEPFSLVDLLPVVLDLVDPTSAPRPTESSGWPKGKLPLLNIASNIANADGLEWLDAEFLDRQGAAVETRRTRFTHPPAGGIPLPRVFDELVGRTVGEIDAVGASDSPTVVLDERLLPSRPAAPGGPVSALLRGRIEADPRDGDCCELALAAGGRVVTTLRVETDVDPLFSTVVPPVEGSEEGAGRLEIFRIVTSGDEVRLLRLAVREGRVPDGARGRVEQGATE